MNSAFLTERIWLLVGVGLALGISAGFSHESTRRAHERSLGLRDGKFLIAAADLRAPAPDAAAAAHMCQLTVRLVDAATGRPRPGLVRVKGAEGNVVPLPGLVNRGIGLRSSALEWYALNEAATVPVPRSVLTIEAIAGLETEVARKTVDLSGRPSARADLPLKAFSSAARNGWFAGNTHLHLHTISRAQADEYLRTIPRSDALDVVFVSYLEQVRPSYLTSNEYTLADLERFGGRGLFFGNGEEHRHDFAEKDEISNFGYGHVMFLNIRELVKPVTIGKSITGRDGPDWPTLRPGITQARGQGATVVWCHNRQGFEDVPSWLHGLIDAQNIFDGGSIGTYEDTFYRYLNVGLQVPFSSGTDWFIYDFARVYARIDGELTAPKWLAALKAGRSFISNGPMLEFRVGRSQIGETIKVSKPTQLTVTGNAKSRHDFLQLEVVRNGRVVERVSSRAVGGHFEAELKVTVAVDEPAWLALRVPAGSVDGPPVLHPTLPLRGSGPKNEMGRGVFAHTSPIYVEFAGHGVFQRDAAQSLLAEMDSALRKIPASGTFESAGQREEVLQIYRDGIATLRRRLGE